MKQITLFYQACFTLLPKAALLFFLSTSSFSVIANNGSTLSGPTKVIEVIEGLFSRKVIELNEADLKSGNSGKKVSGMATFFRSEKVMIEASLSGTDLQSFTVIIDGEFSLRARHFLALTDQKMNQWLPGSLQKGVQIRRLSLAFKPTGNKLKTMALQLVLGENWQPVSAMPLEITDMTGEYEIGNYSGPGKKNHIFRLLGKSKIGRSTINLAGETNRTSKDWVFTAELASVNLSDLFNNLIPQKQRQTINLPTGSLAIDIKGANLILKPQQKSLSLKGNTSYGEIEANISPINNRKNSPIGYVFGYGLPKGFPFRDIDPILKPLESIELENTAMVISSEARQKSDLAAIQRMGVDARLNRGINILAKYDLRPSGLDRLLKLEKINIRGAFSNNVNDFLLAGDIDTNIPLGSKATFQKLTLNLKPAPGKMEASLSGEIDLLVDQDRLLFRGSAGVNATTQALLMEAALDGVWNDPFDIKGLSLEDLWMRMDLSFRTVPIPMPGIGLAGKMKIKNFMGDVTMYVNPAIPSESMIDAGLNELTMKAILETFTSEKIRRNISKDIRNTLESISIRNTRLTVVPNPVGVTINNQTYDPGFRIKGEGSIQGLDIKMAVSVDYDDGVSAYGELEQIKYGSTFRLTGSRGNPNPLLDIEVNATKPPKIRATGLVNLMGLQAESDIFLNDQGFGFFIGGKIFNSFEAQLTVNGTNLKKAPGFYVKAEMKQDLMEYITKKASEEVDRATKETQNDFRNAKKDITKWQTEVKRLNPLIEQKTAVIQKKRDRDMAKVKVAENAVEGAREKVLGIQKSIDGKHEEIKKLDDRVKAKKKWIADAPNIIEKGKRSGLSTKFFAEQAALRGVKMGQVAAFETSKASANVGLISAREVLKGVQHLSKFTPVELDPSVAPLIAAKTSALGSLEAAKLTLSGAEIISVGTLKATKFIIDNGPHQVVKINYAMFEGKLDIVEDGFVKLRVKGTFANDPLDKTFMIHLRNPLDDIIKFADGLLGK